MTTQVDIQVTQSVRDVVTALVDRYGAEKVILFGSMATGNSTEDSDVDLLVVKATDLPFYDRLREVALVCQWRSAFDVLVYTPAEFAEMSRANAFVRDEIVGKGRVLYDCAA